MLLTLPKKELESLDLVEKKNEVSIFTKWANMDSSSYP